jgi:hypothetical protein
MSSQGPVYSPPPKPSHNGGLYTGAPFAANAPWRNFPATPDGAYLTGMNLRSANPPPGAISQFAGSVRPGNNYQEMPAISWMSAQHAALCRTDDTASCTYVQQGEQLKGNRPAHERFASLYHL